MVPTHTPRCLAAVLPGFTRFPLMGIPTFSFPTSSSCLLFIKTLWPQFIRSQVHPCQVQFFPRLVPLLFMVLFRSPTRKRNTDWALHQTSFPDIHQLHPQVQEAKLWNFDFNLMTSRLIRWHKCLESILFSVFSGLSPTTFTSFWSSTGLGGLSNCSSMQVVYMNLKFMAMFPSGFMLVSPQLGALRKHLGILEA